MDLRGEKMYLKGCFLGFQFFGRAGRFARVTARARAASSSQCKACYNIQDYPEYSSSILED